MKNLAFQRSPASVPFDELKALLRSHVVPVNFHATDDANFHSLVRSFKLRFREIILTLQGQTSEFSLGDQPEIQLRDRLIAGVNYSDI